MGLFSRNKEESKVSEAKAPVPVESNTFEKELTLLINKYSLEGLSNTPDFILAFYMKDCLVAFQNAQQRRTQWYADRVAEKVYASDHRPSQLQELKD